MLHCDRSVCISVFGGRCPLGGVVVPDFRRDAEVGAQENRSQLRYQLLAGIVTGWPRLQYRLGERQRVEPGPRERVRYSTGAVNEGIIAVR